MLERAIRLLAILLLFGASACGGDSTTDGDEGGGGFGDDGSGDGGEGGGGEPPGDEGGDEGGGGGGSAGQLTAADWDDNANFEHFLDTLAELRGQAQLPTPVLADRVVISVTDAAGEPVSGVTVEVASGDSTYLAAPTTTDGRLLFFPERDGAAEQEAVTVTIGGESFPAPQGSEWAFELAEAQAAPPDGLDVAFVIDATGSMTDEIDYVKAEVADIAANVQESSGNESLRFALIVYRDEGDEYVTRTTDFTSLGEFQDSLDQQDADGGGDYPEAMDEAMAAMGQLAWRDGNVARVAFLIADAPPHPENAGRFLSVVEDHRRAGVKIYPVAASGVAQEAEYLMRLAAQATLSRYIFLTDDSGIGSPHEEPLIPCYHVQLLNDILSRVLESELAGAWIQPDAEQIIRSVGEPQDGVCVQGDKTYHL